VTPWLIIAGDLTPLGGMDVANHALARHLAVSGAEVHLVTHRAWPDLIELPGVQVHPVWRPLGSHLLGGPLLSRAGQAEWQKLRVRGARAVVNGGNCQIPAANWVHYLHAAYVPPPDGHAAHSTKAALIRPRDLAAERAAISQAQVVLCNSRRTKADVVERLGVPEYKVDVIYYGSDPVRFPPIQPAERLTARRTLTVDVDRPLIGFIGALGDRRKGFDTLFNAWRTLCARSQWDADLVVVGSGAERPQWQARARDAGLAGRIHFLGFRTDVPEILAALDAVVHPARYEAYGLSVHEAICRGVPAIVSASAGVAEKYPPALADLLIQDPNDSEELVGRLSAWRGGLERYRALLDPVSCAFRTRTWDAMAAEIASCVERAA
jgi:glycosyltransferase involved in cell wall biosynthesis